MTNPALIVRDLRKRYGSRDVVNGVSFSVDPGEVLGVLGPNGAGKTTTVECIESLREPDAGEIVVLGVPFGPRDPAFRKRIGVQLQSTGVYPKHTVREVVDLFRAFYDNPMTTNEALELVSLTESARVPSSKLSGGQAQRLSLILALLNHPEIAFLDEPTTGLDPQARRGIWDAVRQVRERGCAVLLTTHYMEEAEVLCDRVAIMDHGSIIELGPPRTLIDKHFGETAIEISGPVAGQDHGLGQLPSVSHASDEGGKVVLFSHSVPTTLAALMEHARDRGIELGNIVVRQASLEDVFLKLTGRRLQS